MISTFIFRTSLYFFHFKMCYHFENLISTYSNKQPFGQHFFPFIFYMHLKICLHPLWANNFQKRYHFFHLHFSGQPFSQILFVCSSSLTYFQMCPSSSIFELVCDTVYSTPLNIHRSHFPWIKQLCILKAREMLLLQTVSHLIVNIYILI